MDERMRKDSQMVMSAKALEAIYHIASSSVGKLISGKHYIGGYELDKLRDTENKNINVQQLNHQHIQCPMIRNTQGLNSKSEENSQKIK